MVSFSGRLSACFWTKCGSAAVFGTGTAPPWTFLKRLRAESSSRSRRTVMSETRSRSESAETETPPGRLQLVKYLLPPLLRQHR